MCHPSALLQGTASSMAQEQGRLQSVYGGGGARGRTAQTGKEWKDNQSHIQLGWKQKRGGEVPPVSRELFQVGSPALWLARGLVCQG